MIIYSIQSSDESICTCTFRTFWSTSTSMKYFLLSTSILLVLGEKYLYLYLYFKKTTFSLKLKYKKLVLVFAMRNKMCLTYAKNLVVLPKFDILFTDLQRSLCQLVSLMKSLADVSLLWRLVNESHKLLFFILIYICFFSYLDFV